MTDHKNKNSGQGRKIPFLFSLVPFAVLIPLLYFSVKHWEVDVQIPLLIATVVAAVLGLGFGWSWGTIERSIMTSVLRSMIPILTLLVIGMLTGSWILSGIVPSLIYYGLELIDPRFFVPLAMVICSIVALSCGSSWTTAGTIGVSLMAVAKVLEINEALTAGAIISGAYFGDKISPLSDTTNLASAVAESKLFDHIREMMPVTVVAYVISLIVFTFFSFEGGTAADLSAITETQAVLGEKFLISIWLLLIPMCIIPIALFRIPALPGLILLLGISVLISFWIGFEPSVVLGNLSKGFVAELGNSEAAVSLNELLSRGGFESMLWTVSLILFAMAFGGVMEGTGMLDSLMKVFLAKVHTAKGYMIATLGTSIGMNTAACDQYLAIAVTGKMYRKQYKNLNIPNVSLSNALESSGTVTSPLIPWNTCAITMSGYFGVGTLAYMPFAVFNYATPIVAAVFILFGIFTSKAAKNAETVEDDLTLPEEVEYFLD